ncbi:MDR family MFS transporter [Neobacillus massiliamazoniensis]|jgi:EmrB/QacA subfamily drug resistance transporter|uniref:Drug resistance MFS transporter n=1 Tax=Neobacillus massiliamazoniensis TaxID=1499688 RepID=A0A0U1NUC1_9BACI|nr:MDR family MFS transporter [Neobacillus massiliamazoniensis]CRK81651.1 drug resistance MFS transporter [Neobacillus massiliamazoniensis]
MIKKDTNLKPVVAGLLLGILMAAMDNTIVATAMPTIVSDLGGFDKFIWVTSAYMVAVMAGMPIFGKLSDMYGRKRFFMFGSILFLVGSALCGLAQSIVQLSIFRAIQGIGGGALMPIAFTIVFDIFPPENRGKMTGLLGAVFGSASILGPLLGAYITDYISWHWIFYVNVPIGIVSIFLIMRYYHESLQHSKQRIDWWGAITLVISVVSLMFALELGGKQYAWKSAQIISLFVSFFVFFVAFFIAELKAEEPILPLWLFKRRLFAASQILAFLYGGTFIILTVFIPIFVQAVYGGSAKNSGLILTPMMLGSVAGSSIAGIFMAKTSYRNIMFVSFISYVAGMYLLSSMTVDTAHWLLTIYMILVGFGVGFSFSLLPTASIHNLEPQYRGTANSTNSFLRSFGMTLGVTIFGTIQGNLFADKLKEAFKGMQGGGNFKMGDPREIFQADQRSKIPSFILDKIVHAMSDSITHTFMLALIPIALIAITIFFMGKARVVTANKTGAKS